MTVKRLPGVFGFCLAYDSFTRSIIITFVYWCWKFHWPRVGACNGCGHGPGVHSARRSGGFILWECVGCACTFYRPEGKL